MTGFVLRIAAPGIALLGFSSLSYGANDMRDGVSLSAQRKTRDLILPSEITNLDNLEGYIRLPGQIPKGHFKMVRPPITKVAPAFVAAPTVGSMIASNMGPLR